MKCVVKGNKTDEQIWYGICRQCKAEFEAVRHELTIEHCMREKYEFAHATCSECGGNAGVLLYPKDVAQKTLTAEILDV